VWLQVPGVTSTSVGYTGGHHAKPTYEDVSSGDSGHAEAVLVKFDPAQVSYEKLLHLFWDKHDPTTPNQQGNDQGSQYRSAVFYFSVAQRKTAESVSALRQKGLSQDIVTEIKSVQKYHEAEGYHQQYLEKLGQTAAKGDASPIRCYGPSSPAHPLLHPIWAAKRM